MRFLYVFLLKTISINVSFQDENIRKNKKKTGVKKVLLSRPLTCLSYKGNVQMTSLTVSYFGSMSGTRFLDQGSLHLRHVIVSHN